MIQLSKLNWNRLGFFILGAFLGNAVMGMVGGVLKRA